MRFFLLIAFLPAFLRADAFGDLRSALGQLGATTPVHGSFNVTSTSTNNEDDRPTSGKATVEFDIGDAGLRLVYPKAILAQADQEARSEAIDPERLTPTRSGLRRIRALHLAELLDGAGALTTTLEYAQLVDTKPAAYHGKPARLVTFKLTPKMSKASARHVKKLESTLSVWLGDDGVPIAAERSVHVKASFLLMSFENTQKENWTYARVGDRLVATRYESDEKSEGLGQHGSTQVTEVVRIE